MVPEEELVGPLELFPPVDFCCAYGSSLLSNNHDKGAMVDYILGVADPVKWHTENLERNKQHYAKWMSFLGPKTINWVANRVGVGVYFNPFVQWKQKMIKYGVVGMQNLSNDLLMWDRFYIAGRLQKPVRILVDNHGIGKVNAVNLKAAVTAALLLLPPKFTEEDLYCKICCLSYMGDLRMLFAEDKDKVQKIVQGSFSHFQAIYRPLTADYTLEGLLESACHGKSFKQDCRLPNTISLFTALPQVIQRSVLPRKTNLCLDRDNVKQLEAGSSAVPFAITSREEAVNSTRRVLRRLVMISSARQAAAGVLAAGGVNAARYLGRKMSKSWSSRIS